MIRLLEWDSEFFGYKVGECRDAKMDYDSILSLAKAERYKLVYLRFEVGDASKKFEKLGLFCDRRIVFEKKIISDQSRMADQRVISVLKQEASHGLMELALLSGKFSRFNLDQNFKSGEFSRLYKVWLEKSLSGEESDEVLGFVEAGEILGFVTLRKNQENGSVGLIAVSPKAQKSGIGSKLLMASEDYCERNNLKRLLIPTQKVNEDACRFYLKNNYKEVAEELICHLWV